MISQIRETSFVDISTAVNILLLTLGGLFHLFESNSVSACVSMHVSEMSRNIPWVSRCLTFVICDFKKEGDSKSTNHQELGNFSERKARETVQRESLSIHQEPEYGGTDQIIIFRGLPSNSSGGSLVGHSLFLDFWDYSLSPVLLYCRLSGTRSFSYSCCHPPLAISEILQTRLPLPVTRMVIPHGSAGRTIRVSLDLRFPLNCLKGARRLCVLQLPSLLSD